MLVLVVLLFHDCCVGYLQDTCMRMSIARRFDVHYSILHSNMQIFVLCLLLGVGGNGFLLRNLVRVLGFRV